VYDDLTTERVLAMDFIEGLPLDRLYGEEYPQRLRNRIGSLLYELALSELFDFRLLQSDPNFANYLLLPATRQLALLDFGGTRDVPPLLARRYARVLRAAADADRATLREALEEIGFLGPDDGAERVRLYLELFLVGFEPFRHRGPYDFAASSAPVRVRDVGFQLAFATGAFRTPPPDTVFLHRKLAGMFLLCARLGARVDVRSLLLSALDRAGDGEGFSDAAAKPAR
jgi:hypothetical protein